MFKKTREKEVICNRIFFTQMNSFPSYFPRIGLVGVHFATPEIYATPVVSKE